VISATSITIDDVATGDEIIWVMNGNSVAYIVDLTYNAKATTPGLLGTEYSKIIAEQTKPAGTYTVSFAADTTNGDAVADASLPADKTGVEDGKTATIPLTYLDVDGYTTGTSATDITVSNGTKGVDYDDIYITATNVVITGVKNNLTVSVNYTAKTYSITGNNALQTFTAESNTVTANTVKGTPLTGFKTGETVTVAVTAKAASKVFTLTGTYTDANGDPQDITDIRKTTDTDDTGAATFTFTMPAGNVKLNVNYLAATLTLTVASDCTTQSHTDAPTVTGVKNGSVNRTDDLTFTVEPTDEDHYIARVAWSDNANNYVLTPDDDGNYTIPASALATLTTLTIGIHEAEKPVLSNTSSHNVIIDGTVIAATSGTYHVDPAATSLVVRVANRTTFTATGKDSSSANVNVAVSLTTANDNGYDVYTLTFPAGTVITLAD
jgi:hypothetical protein